MHVLQDCSYSDGESWMLEDPLQDEQNAKRILQIWQPLIESFRHSPADQLKPKLLALCGSFGMAARALEMQNADMNSEQCLVHKAMAAMPTCVVHTIALKAGLIWNEPNAGDEQNMPHGHMMVCAWHPAYDMSHEHSTQPFLELLGKLAAHCAVCAGRSPLTWCAPSQQYSDC